MGTKTLLIGLFLLPLSVYAAEVTSRPLPMTPRVSNPAMMGSKDVLLEEGKTLFENAQYLPALGKFMSVLRQDPQNAEARRYLRLVIDVMRKNPSAVSSRPLGQGYANPMPSPELVSEEVQRNLKRRSLLTWDLKAIPGVKVEEKESQVQIVIESSVLFADKTGGLKEGSIPLLDRVVAWLETFGRQPVIIHCLPEETQDPQVGGGLFLRRYASLYSFFVEERRLPAGRFVSADLLNPQTALPTTDSPTVVNSSDTPRVIIEAVGSRLSHLGSLSPEADRRVGNRWLEFSVLSSKNLINPEEGEWASLDLAALTRAGLRKWEFNILPADKPQAKAVMSMEGKGNLLQRVNWDGRDQTSGSFVAPGAYVCRLTATDADGYSMTQEHVLQLLLNSETPAPVVAKKPARKSKAAKKAKPKPALEPEDLTNASTPERAVEVPVTETPAAPTGNSVQAIWKQIIEFESGQSELKPSLKSSLERIGKTMEVYPRQKVRIMGYADASENGGAALAKQRASLVKQILIDDYHVSPERVMIAGGQSSGGHKVEISITN